MSGEKTIIAVRLTPRSGRDQIGAYVDGALEARVAAPPIDGAANEALLKLLAKRLNLSKSELRIVSGETSRHKRVACPLSAEEISKRLS